ncbi:hypothetical protein X798_06558 [Onchocerca flexuosa]|uniref:T-box domain-containing protein n=2 Tax=Onchocerca flexuosa TaxID=387005 RepID=A0A183HL92_9BILA|nr:hypothetical protein X798_06558 [Onchocerca flexuosa]VDO54800.1 unnamed protein product [Onchocerca flexuosa]
MSTKPFSIAYLIGDTVTDNNNGNVSTDFHNNNCVNKTNQRSDKLKLFPTTLNNDTIIRRTNNSNNTENNSNYNLIPTKSSIILRDYHPALRNVSMRLEGSTLWNKFHAYGTEMIVTKTGR